MHAPHMYPPRGNYYDQPPPPPSQRFSNPYRSPPMYEKRRNNNGYGNNNRYYNNNYDRKRDYKHRSKSPDDRTSSLSPERDYDSPNERSIRKEAMVDDLITDQQQQQIVQPPPPQHQPQPPATTPLSAEPQEQPQALKIEVPPIEKKEEALLCYDLPALPSKEQLLASINALDAEIVKIQADLECAQRELEPPKPEVVQEQVEETAKPNAPVRNKMQQIYYENREKCKRSHSAFDYLVFDKYQCPLQNMQISDLALFKDVVQAHTTIIPAMEAIIKQTVEEEMKREESIVAQYKHLHKAWKEQVSQNLLLHPVDNVMIDSLIHSINSTQEQTRRYKKTLTNPTPMLTLNEKDNVFESYNLYTENPKAQWEDKLIETKWTEEKRKKFLELFQVHQKDFHKIASIMENVTTGEVVNYYYLYKKKDVDMKRIIKDLKGRRKYRKRIFDEGGRNRGLVGIQAETKSTANSFPATDGYLRPRVARAKPIIETDTPAAPIQEEDSWNPAEKSAFMELLVVHGKNFTAISRLLKSKSPVQCKQYFIANNARLNLENILPKKKKEKPGRKKQEPVDEAVSLEVQKVRAKQKAATKKVAIWPQAEKELFFQLFEQFGRDWKKLAELMPSKTELQLKQYYKNWKILLGLAPDGKIAKKKKRKIFGLDIIADDTAPELCSLANLAEEVAKEGSGIEEVRNIIIDQEESDMEEEEIIQSTVQTTTPVILAPPKRPRMHLLSYQVPNTRPTLHFNSLLQFDDDNFLAQQDGEARRTSSQQELANLELLGSLAFDSFNASASKKSKSDKHKYAKNHEGKASKSQDQSKPRNAKDKFFAGSTFVAPPSFLNPLAQQFAASQPFLSMSSPMPLPAANNNTPRIPAAATSNNTPQNTTPPPKDKPKKKKSEKRAQMQQQQPILSDLTTNEVLQANNVAFTNGEESKKKMFVLEEGSV